MRFLPHGNSIDGSQKGEGRRVNSLFGRKGLDRDRSKSTLQQYLPIEERGREKW